MNSAGAPLRFLFLVFVIQRDADRVMGVVRLVDQVGDGELQLVRPQAPLLRARRQAVARAEEQQDVRGLADRQSRRP